MADAASLDDILNADLISEVGQARTLDDILAVDLAPAQPQPTTQAPSQPATAPRLFGFDVTPELAATARGERPLPLPTPQQALDLAGQGVGTGLGIAGGALTSHVTGPVGPIVGGAAGNVTGKQVARMIGQYFGLEGSDRPELASIETAIDSLIGASGPAVSAVARPMATKFFGGGRAALEKVAETGAAFKQQTAGLKQVSRGTPDTNPFDDLFATPTPTKASADAVFKTIVDGWKKAGVSAESAKARALKLAIRDTPVLDNQTINLATGAAAVLANPLQAAAVYLGGHAIKSTHVGLARAFIGSPNLVKWALTRSKDLKTATQIATSLAAEAATLSGQDRQTGQEMAAALRELVVERRRAIPPRNARGQFTSGPAEFSRAVLEAFGASP